MSIRQRIGSAWRTLKTLLLLLSFPLFTIIGGAMILDGIASGNRTTVLYGAAGVLFFGLGGVFMFGILFSEALSETYTRLRGDSHETSEIELHTISHRGASHQALVFPAGSRAVPFVASLVLAGWTVAALAFAIASDTLLVRFVLLVTAGLAGILGLVGIAQVLRNPVPLALLADGVVVRSLYRSSFVPWEAITEIETFVYGSQWLFGVAVTNHNSIEQPWITARITKPNRSLTGYDLVSRANTRLTPDDVEAISRWFLTRPGDREQIERIATVADFETDLGQNTTIGS